MANEVNWQIFANLAVSCSICIANSLVGAITKTIGPSPFYKMERNVNENELPKRKMKTKYDDNHSKLISNI